MPSVGQILPYVLRLVASDRQWCLRGILDHTVGQARSASVKPISNIALSCLKYSTFSCAVVRLRRMAYCWREGFPYAVSFLVLERISNVASTGISGTREASSLAFLCTCTLYLSMFPAKGPFSCPSCHSPTASGEKDFLVCGFFSDFRTDIRSSQHRVVLAIWLVRSLKSADQPSSQDSHKLYPSYLRGIVFCEHAHRLHDCLCHL